MPSGRSIFSPDSASDEASAFGAEVGARDENPTKGESMIQKYPRRLAMLFAAMALAVASPTTYQGQDSSAAAARPQHPSSTSWCCFRKTFRSTTTSGRTRTRPIRRVSRNSMPPEHPAGQQSSERRPARPKSQFHPAVSFGSHVPAYHRSKPRLHPGAKSL